MKRLFIIFAFLFITGLCFAEDSRNYIYYRERNINGLDCVVSIQEGKNAWEGYYELIAFEYDNETNVATVNTLFSKTLNNVYEILGILETNRKYFSYETQFNYSIKKIEGIKFVNKETTVQNVPDSPEGTAVFIISYYLYE